MRGGDGETKAGLAAGNGRIADRRREDALIAQRRCPAKTARASSPSVKGRIALHGDGALEPAAGSTAASSWIRCQTVAERVVPLLGLKPNCTASRAAEALAGTGAVEKMKLRARFTR